MKWLVLFIPVAFFYACSFDVGFTERKARIPAVPDAWFGILGEPAWLFVWYGPDGTERKLDVNAGSMPSLDLPDAVASPVLAYPHWPILNIEAGIAKPAGAIFPFDVRGGKIDLSWKGGAAAVFYRELLRSGGPADRLPERFDWPRFRALMDSDSIHPAAREDPWTVDWRTVAGRTRVSGFDRRRIKPRDVVGVQFKAPRTGAWVLSSPFKSRPVYPDKGVLYLDASEEPDSLLSASGVLRFGQEAAAWFPNKPLE